MTLTALVIFLFALIGGWLSRMCGGGPPRLPFGLDQWLYAIPYALIGLPVLAPLALGAAGAVQGKNIRRYVGAILLFPFAGAFLGKRTGHGNGLDLGRAERGEDEVLEFIIKPLHGKIPEYWYDVLLMCVTGICVTLVAGIVVAVVNPLAGAILALSGLMKGPAYMIGYAIYPTGIGKGIPHLNEASAIGEFLTGFFGYGILALVATMIWGMA